MERAIGRSTKILIGMALYITTYFELYKSILYVAKSNRYAIDNLSKLYPLLPIQKINRNTFRCGNITIRTVGMEDLGYAKDIAIGTSFNKLFMDHHLGRPTSMLFEVLDMLHITISSKERKKERSKQNGGQS